VSSHTRSVPSELDNLMECPCARHAESEVGALRILRGPAESAKRATPMKAR